MFDPIWFKEPMNKNGDLNRFYKRLVLARSLCEAAGCSSVYEQLLPRLDLLAAYIWTAGRLALSIWSADLSALVGMCKVKRSER